MNKLRENTGVILWILVISFGVIWTLQDSNVFDTRSQPERNAAVVNGKSISTQEYENTVQRQQRRFQQQMSRELSGRMEDRIRQRVYDQLVNNALREQEMERLGITVTDAEIENMVFGENPHPMIRRMFADSTGQINYQLLKNMAQNPQANPRFLQLEQALEQQRRQEKLNSLINSTVYVSKADVEEYHWKQNASASVEYVAKRYASVSDDSISVTESDLKSYYDNNKDDFKRKKTLTLDYVTLSKEPTAKDTAAVLNDLEELRDEFANTQNDSLFLARQDSKWSFTTEYANPTELHEDVAKAVFKDPTAGRIAGPMAGDRFGHLVKIRDVKPAEKEFLHASHILLKSSDENPDLRTKLDSIRTRIESGAANFAEMARQHSDDPSSSEGGDLGWFGKGDMVSSFENAAFDAEPGSLVGPIKSKFGYHLIRVHGRTDKAVQIADLSFDLRPSQNTLSERKSTLENVAFYANESSSFAEEAKREGLTVNQVQAEADQRTVPGIGQSRALPAFMENAKEGDISDVFELDDKFALVKVTEVKPKGHRPFEDVKAQIRPQVVKQKKRDILSRRMKTALTDNGFEQLPSALQTSLRTESDLSFTAESVPGVGNDPTFAGTVFGLEDGKTSGVVEGKNAAFVVRVTSMTNPPELTASKREEIRQKLRKQRQETATSQWIAALREDATIKDQRQFQ